MAITAKENPRYYAGPLPELDSHLAKDCQTWHAGEWCVLASTGKVAPIGTTALVVYGMFADSQPTATSASNVKVWKITSPETSFIGYVSTGASDKVAAVTDIGGAGVRVTSNGTDNVMTIDTNNDTATSQLVKVTDLLYKKEGFKNVSTDNPGQVIFKVKSGANIQG